LHALSHSISTIIIVSFTPWKGENRLMLKVTNYFPFRFSFPFSFTFCTNQLDFCSISPPFLLLLSSLLSFFIVKSNYFFIIRFHHSKFFHL
jgi:hypothetical protein